MTAEGRAQLSGATKRRRNLLSQRKTTMDLLQSADHGREALAFLNKSRHTSPSLAAAFTDIHDADSALNIIELAVRESLDNLRPYVNAPASLMENIETVAVGFDDAASATSESFPDGSHLIRVSDSLMSLTGYLSELLTVWSKSKSRFLPISFYRRVRQSNKIEEHTETDQAIKGGSAALRYYILHQRTLAISAKIGSTRSLKQKTSDPEGVFGPLGLQFIVAHELGHIALGHTLRNKERSTKSDLHNLEYEADRFALTSLTAFLDDEAAALISACIGLSAISLSSDPLFVRSPESHPNASDRINRLAETVLPQSAKVAASCWGLFTMVDQASDMTAPLPSDRWDAMNNSPFFDTSVHSPGYYEIFRGLDQSIAHSPGQIVETIERFFAGNAPPDVMKELQEVDVSAVRTALALNRDGNLESALDALSIDNPVLLQKNRPLSFHTLIQEILDSAAISRSGPEHGSGDRLTRSCFSAMIANSFSHNLRTG